MFVLLCLGIGLSTYFQKLFFGRGGENLTFTLRVKLFTAILHKNIGWFDNKNRAPGILTNIITEDISSVNGLTTETVGIAVEAGLGLTFSCLICFILIVVVSLVVTGYARVICACLHWHLYLLLHLCSSWFQVNNDTLLTS